jgi:hypothetical protein
VSQGKALGVDGTAFSYFAAIALIGPPLAWAVFAHARRDYLAVDALSTCASKAA